jgi:hypothetical protein
MKYNKEILNVLFYKSIFNQSLSKYQIIYFIEKKVESISDFDKSLNSLVEKKEITYEKEKYIISDNNKKFEKLKSSKKNKNNDSIFHNENRNFHDAKEAFDELDKVIFYLQKIPFIKFIGVTGSLSSYFYNKDEDIDLFIICEDNRVWLTRFFNVIILKILNVYVNNKNPLIKICPNIYISESTLSWPKEKRNFYTAHEIAMMQPIYDRDNFYLKFLVNNSWIRDFLPNLNYEFYIPASEKNKEGSFLDLLDLVFMKIQKSFMSKKRFLEVLNRNFIHFLHKDHTIDILNLFYEKSNSSR